jgi:NTP pyrophosphatase (non-canonical NTP hydrolase)
MQDKQPIGINALAATIYEQNKVAGWYDKPREVGTRLALIHSEISEALEGDRKGLMDDHLPHRSMFEVELADAVIRILDLAGSKSLDLEGAIEEKLAYNQRRLDHKQEVRALAGGKAY